MILILTAIISLIAGMFSALLGIGGGLILVPLFHYVLKMNLHVAIGTSLAVIVPTAFVGTFRHASGHYVDWRIFFFSVIFAMIGGLIGAGISMNLDVAVLRKIFAVFLFLVAIKMFFQ
ncbi:MAG: sulfite exporter TauE/SafE family protein [Candidatus Omnitrophica bacterium]|nr:sulfite exporter TauE/SafE family protein [Candidatus Omnitrophota bacterium]